MKFTDEDYANALATIRQHCQDAAAWGRAFPLLHRADIVAIADLFGREDCAAIQQKTSPKYVLRDLEAALNHLEAAAGLLERHKKWLLGMEEALDVVVYEDMYGAIIDVMSGQIKICDIESIIKENRYKVRSARTTQKHRTIRAIYSIMSHSRGFALDINDKPTQDIMRDLCLAIGVIENRWDFPATNLKTILGRLVRTKDRS